MRNINAAYIRVSTPRPKEDDGVNQNGESSRKNNQEESIPKQIELLTAWFKELGFSGELRFFIDDASGKNEDRENLLALIELIYKNEVARLFYYDDSRQARNSYLTQRLLWHCDQHRTEIWPYHFR